MRTSGLRFTCRQIAEAPVDWTRANDSCRSGDERAEILGGIFVRSGPARPYAGPKVDDDRDDARWELPRNIGPCRLLDPPLIGCPRPIRSIGRWGSRVVHNPRSPARNHDEPNGARAPESPMRADRCRRVMGLSSRTHDRPTIEASIGAWPTPGPCAEHLFPAAGARAAKESYSRGPGAVVAVQKPAKVRHERDRDPDGDAEPPARCASDVSGVITRSRLIMIAGVSFISARPGRRRRRNR